MILPIIVLDKNSKREIMLIDLSLKQTSKIRLITDILILVDTFKIHY
jgi:hypothetical protein